MNPFGTANNTDGVSNTIHHLIGQMIPDSKFVVEPRPTFWPFVAGYGLAMKTGCLRSCACKQKHANYNTCGIVLFAKT